MPKPTKTQNQNALFVKTYFLSNTLNQFLLFFLKMNKVIEIRCKKSWYYAVKDIRNLWIICWNYVGLRPVASGGLRGLKPSQFLADQLTLSQPGGAHSPHPVLRAPPDFQTLRRPWIGFTDLPKSAPPPAVVCFEHLPTPGWHLWRNSCKGKSAYRRHFKCLVFST